MTDQELPESEFVKPDLKNPDLFWPNLGNVLIRRWIEDDKTKGGIVLVNKEDRYVGFVLRAGNPDPLRPSEVYVRGDTIVFPGFVFAKMPDKEVSEDLVLMAARDVLTRVGEKRDEVQTQD